MKKLFYLLCCMFAALLVGCETNEPTNTEKTNSSSSGGGSGNANNHAYVDLGLSVKWATCNVGANSPEEYGDYFAWGEIKPKAKYNWETYKWCNVVNGFNKSTITKYCTDTEDGTVDNKTILELLDDAANANWGGDWRMPTKEEQEELRKNCTWTWSKKNGVNGYTVTGPNGNSIFLPAAGIRYDSDLYYAGSYGYYYGFYWSSSLSSNYSDNACNLHFSSYGVDWYDNDRDHGLSVRPVMR